MWQQSIAEIYANHSQKVFATLIRLVGDFDLAEECMQEAFAAAIQQWPKEGLPNNPTAWLISTGKFKAVDVVRRNSKFRDLQPAIIQRVDNIHAENDSIAGQDLQDDTLRLIFTCCHPAIDPKTQVPLTLREICGLTTEEIARAFLTTPTTMAQRIVRGKQKIRDANIPYVVPSIADIPERLAPVLSVIYLVYNEGYSASSGDQLTRVDLSAEAIRLARLILPLLPNPEVQGLLALMLLHESRRKARTSSDGEIILLQDQDRTLWNKDMIAEGKSLIQQAFISGQFGSYVLQAAISAVHADAANADATDWNEIVGLYELIKRVEPSPIVLLNQAVAVAMRDGPQAGLEIVESIIASGELQDYHLLHSAHGELLRRSGHYAQAKAALHKALDFTKLEPERRLLSRRIQEVETALNSGS